jgi:preprotein translocase subunit SecG
MTRIKLWLATIVATIGLILAALSRARKDGRTIERAKRTEDDNARADAIRDRVADARRRGVQPDDARGYRD